MLILGALERPRQPPGGGAPRWAVSGSAALALHGLPVTCRDLDILTSAYDAERVAASVPGLELEPLALRVRAGLRARIARFRVAGVEVEILGDVEDELPGGGWTGPPRLGEEVEHVELLTRRCPLMSLPALRAAYEAIGSPEKLALIEIALKAPPGLSGSGTSSSRRLPPRGRS